MGKRTFGLIPSAFAVVFAAALAVVSAASCDARLINLGRGTVSIAIGQSDARTVLPSLNPVEYRLKFVGAVPVPDLVTSKNAESRLLPAGEWRIDAEGRDSSGTLVAKGSSETFAVAAGKTVAVTVRLSALETGNGRVEVRLTWPAAVSPAPDGARAFLDGEPRPAAEVSLDLASSPRTAVFSAELPAGSYKLKIDLLASAAVRYAYDEAVQVSGGALSSKTVALTEDHFLRAPTAPTSLAAAETATGVALTWTDTSTAESGYSVERRAPSAAWEVLASALAPNAASYLDASATLGVPYDYRVAAFNANGPSAYATAAGLRAAPVPGSSGSLAVGTRTSASVALSWARAADNATPQSSLVYRLYQSASDNIRTTAEMKANGTLVGAATADLTSRTATGLAAATTYWFNVLVSDQAGYEAAYQAVSAATEAATGTVSVTIEVVGPSDVPMDVTFEFAPLQMAFVGTLAQTYDSYDWTLDGASYGTAKTVTIPAAGIAAGPHRLTLWVTSGGRLYSKSLDVVVRN